MDDFIKQLYDIFYYTDGHLHWRCDRGTRVKKGDVAGSLDPSGYVRIRFDGKLYRAHRLIFAMHHRIMPKMIDHANGIKTDNNIDNLRECTRGQNRCNSKLSVNNSSGVKGVMWNKAAKKWMVQLNINGNRKYLGYFDDLSAAQDVVMEARDKYHGVFARHA